MKYLRWSALLVLLIACSKSKVTTPTLVDTCDQITESFDPHPYTALGPPTAVFTYDDQGRLSHVKGQLQNQAIYTYYNDSIVLSATDIYGVDIGTTYYLDNQHRVTKTRFYDFDFQYNTDGYMTSCKLPYGNNGQIMGYTSKFLTYTNGNLTEVTTSDPNVVPQKISFGYYDEPNQDLMGYNSPLYIAGILGDRNSFFLVRGGYFGKQSKNLYKSLDWNTPGYPPGTVGYNKDSSGRATEMITGFSFTYRCP
jgi:Domain of unknown function (DUF4595) with porin-like fold